MLPSTAMDQRVSSGSLPRWTSVGRPTLAARLALLALIAVGHVVFLAGLSPRNPELLPAMFFAACNTIPLAMVLFGRPRRPLTAARLVARNVVLLAGVLPVAGTALELAQRSPHFHGLSMEETVCLFAGGGVFGLLGCTVAVPLGLAIDRWRAEPTPRRSLDVWAALACVGTVFAIYDGTVWRSHHATVCAALFATAGVLLGLTFFLATGVMIWEHRARRWLAGALETAPPGHRVVALDAVDVAGAPSWSLTGLPVPMKALARVQDVEGYRDDASGAAVALIPAREPLSWRTFVLPLVAVTAVIGLYLRLS